MHPTFWDKEQTSHNIKSKCEQFMVKIKVTNMQIFPLLYTSPLLCNNNLFLTHSLGQLLHIFY